MINISLDEQGHLYLHPSSGRSIVFRKIQRHISAEIGSRLLHIDRSNEFILQCK